MTAVPRPAQAGRQARHTACVRIHACLRSFSKHAACNLNPPPPPSLHLAKLEAAVLGLLLASCPQVRGGPAVPDLAAAAREVQDQAIGGAGGGEVQ